jgi:hypothetical protein
MKSITPRVKLEGAYYRLHLHVSDEDHEKVGRGRAWTAVVTDVPTGRRYRLRGATCGIPTCFCDAIGKVIP